MKHPEMDNRERFYWATGTIAVAATLLVIPALMFGNAVFAAIPCILVGALWTLHATSCKKETKRLYHGPRLQ